MKLIKIFPVRIMLVLFSGLLILGCGSQKNQIWDSYVNPEATKESIKFSKVAVFAQIMKNSTRKIVEDELCTKLINTIALPSYDVVEDDELGKPDLIKARLIKQGFDGALIFRITEAETRESYSSGVYPTAYYSFGGYYGYTYGYMYSPGGHYVTQQRVVAEISIYSITEDKLIWTGQTTNLDAENIEHTIAEISIAVKERLVEDGILNRTE